MTTKKVSKRLLRWKYKQAIPYPTQSNPIQSNPIITSYIYSDYFLHYVLRNWCKSSKKIEVEL